MRPPAIGMTSAVVLPTSMSSASGCSPATASAVATQFAAATSHGRARAASTEMSSPAVVSTLGSPNAASAASSTNATPSRLVRNASDSSAVIVIATASAGSAAISRSTAASPSRSRQTSKGRDTVRSDVPWSQAAFVFAPPMSTASVAGMRVVGVIDLKAGEAVHAVRGERERYRPLGDPLSLARRYGLDELYVADLDAITGGDVQTAVIAALAREARVMVDAGVSEPERARALLDLGVHRVVVGTETLTDADALDRLPDAVLSVDLRDGRTLSRDPRLAGLSALDAVARLAGPREVIVLDLARVGTSAGPDVAIDRRDPRRVPRPRAARRRRRARRRRPARARGRGRGGRARGDCAPRWRYLTTDGPAQGERQLRL